MQRDTGTVEGTAGSAAVAVGGVGLPGGEAPWYAEYVGLAYRTAVAEGLACAGRPPATILKTDLWNECLGEPRDVLGHLHRVDGGRRLVGVDLSLATCAAARRRVPAAAVVQADITALPLRPGSVDAVLDLSTLDHLGEHGVAAALAEYRRVVRAGGVLVVVFWQASALTRLRVLAKRLLGLHEKPDQRYLPVAAVRAAVAAGFAVAGEFVAGTLLVAPLRLTGRALGLVPAPRLSRFLRRLVALERRPAARSPLRHVAGLLGLTAIRRADAAAE